MQQKRCERLQLQCCSQGHRGAARLIKQPEASATDHRAQQQLALLVRAGLPWPVRASDCCRNFNQQENNVLRMHFHQTACNGFQCSAQQGLMLEQLAPVTAQAAVMRANTVSGWGLAMIDRRQHRYLKSSVPAKRFTDAPESPRAPRRLCRNPQFNRQGSSKHFI